MVSTLCLIASLSNHHNGVCSHNTIERAMYSAFILERATKVCSLDDQVIGHRANIMIHPDQDLEIIRSAEAPSGFQFPVKSASTQH